MVCFSSPRRYASPGVSDLNGLRLETIDGRLSLVDPGAKVGPVCVDFLGGAMGYRRARQIGRRELLPRALGVPKRSEAGDYLVVDCTAGLGRDAYVIASLGCPVIAIERHPMMAALLADGLRRAREAGDQAAGRIELVEGDAREWLGTLVPSGEASGEVSDAMNDVVLEGPGRSGPHPQPLPPGEGGQSDTARKIAAIYIDPMFPDLGSSAAVKKEMALTRRLVGADEDAAEVFEMARAITNSGGGARRVVVKRHPGAPTIDGGEADVVFKSKAVRFDVYLNWLNGDGR